MRRQTPLYPLLLTAFLCWSVAAAAQTAGIEPTTGVTSSAPAAVSARATPGTTRGGFTTLVNLGVGYQRDSGLGESSVGLAGANFGIGGFVTPNLAVMFRFSGTNVHYDLGFTDFGQVSGVGGGSLQYWLSDRVSVETGVGLGLWQTTDDDSESGVGLILGASTIVFQRGHHILQLGVEYAPAFTESGTVHNLGFTFGYQFHR